MQAIEEYGRELSKAILEGQGHAPGLLQMRHVKLYGLAEPSRVEERDPTFSFKLENIPDQRMVEHLWTKHRIALRADNFYSRVPEVYDVPTMIRISLVHYNTPEEVEMLLKGLDELNQP